MLGWINSSQTLESILIYRTGSFGDHIVGLPCLHLVAKQFPSHRRILLTNHPSNEKAPSVASIFEGSGLIDEIIYRPLVPRKNPLEMVSLSRKIRGTKVSTLIYLPAGPEHRRFRIHRDLLFFYLCGITTFFGLPDKNEMDRLRLPSGKWEHECSRLARMLIGLGEINLSSRANWDLRLLKEETAWAKQQISCLESNKFLTISISSTIQAKDWPQTRWQALVPMLRRAFPTHGLIAVGAEQDRESSQAVLSHWDGPSLNLCGNALPRQTAAVFAYSDIFFGLDSGPMHLAASLGIPCVVVFAARTLPGIWFPFGAGHEVLYRETSCSNCRLDLCIQEQQRCITSISTDEVLEAALRIRNRGLRNDHS